ncbi:uncharacterized protein BJX67DRAFT_249826 [Aspergillus lucknowensis]|uniref:Uncharacterized protein n=1 Tax=Aspergillus lucknowensis TaxID=176173 RepID=A0ABR4M232_9EURO
MIIERFTKGGGEECLNDPDGVRCGVTKRLFKAQPLKATSFIVKKGNERDPRCASASANADEARSIIGEFIHNMQDPLPHAYDISGRQRGGGGFEKQQNSMSRQDRCTTEVWNRELGIKFGRCWFRRRGPAMDDAFLNPGSTRLTPNLRIYLITNDELLEGCKPRA